MENLIEIQQLESLSITENISNLNALLLDLDINVKHGEFKLCNMIREIENDNMSTRNFCETVGYEILRLANKTKSR